jgi:DNA polymerase V
LAFRVAWASAEPRRWPSWLTVSKAAECKPGRYAAALARVCNLAALAPPALQEVLAATEMREVWGVGRRIAAQLNDSSIHTALELAWLDPAMVRRR